MSAPGHVTYTPVHGEGETSPISTTNVFTTRRTGMTAQKQIPAHLLTTASDRRPSRDDDGETQTSAQAPPTSGDEPTQVNRDNVESDQNVFVSLLQRPKGLKYAWWWWELGAILLNIICICLLVTVLLILKDKPLTRWTQARSISPNTVVSVLATVAKASMMLPIAVCISQLKWSHFKRPRRLQDLQRFDDASRGLWGSLVLLLSTRGYALQTALGAVVTILALGFEPSAQQILSYPSRNITNGTATITHAAQWQSGILAPISNTLGSGSGMVAQNLIMEGLVGNVGNISNSCSTSLCQFPIFESLAVCSECQDVSDAVETRCFTNETAGSFFYHWCSYYPELPYSAWVVDLLTGEASASDGEDTQERLGQTFVIGSTTNFTGPYLINSFNITAVNLTTPAVFGGEGGSFVPGKAQVNACSWSLCAQAFENPEVINGRLQYSVTSSPLSIIDVNSTAMSLATSPDSGSVYSLDRNTITQLWTYVDIQFNSQDPVSEIGAQTGDYFATRDLPAAVDSLARRLTNLIMSDDNLNATQLRGVAVSPEVFVHVRWEWLILPLCLTLATIVLLALSIASTSRSGTALLKSSQLAPLFYELEGWEREKITVAKGDAWGFEKAAEGMRAVFVGGVDEGFVKAG